MRFVLILLAMLQWGVPMVRAQSYTNTSVARYSLAKPQALKADLDNFYQITAQIYSGATPGDDSAFADLAARGIKTIISVDGASPDVEAAKKFGLRYVHLPMGYDGISTNRALELVKA